MTLGCRIKINSDPRISLSIDELKTANRLSLTKIFTL